MDIKLFDSELKVMDILWENGDTTAKEIARQLNEQIGWSKTTTYTVIKKCINKDAIERIGRDFLCHPLVTKDEVREHEAMELVDKMFDGSSDLLIASLLDRKKLSAEQIAKLRKMVDGLEQ